MARQGKAQNHFQKQVRNANQIMPAFLYKGSTTKRSSLTMPDGVLFYDTDLERLFVGDGATVGGKATDTSVATGSIDNTLGATDTVVVDADTTDHTGNYVMNIDAGVNSANCDALRINVDVGTALSAAEIAKGVYVDANPKAADADTSGVIAYDALLTGVATSRADLTGYKVTVDGTHNDPDTVKGLLVTSAVTLDDSAVDVKGVEVEFASITATDYASGEFNGVDVAMPAAYNAADTASAIKMTGEGNTLSLLSGTSAANFGANLVLAADTTAIKVDADTTDHTGSKVVDIDLGVNSASCTALNINADVGTALSAAEIVKGIFVDANATAAQADANTSGIYGVDVAVTGVTGSAADAIGYKVLLDGTHDQGDSTQGIFVDVNATVNNVAEVLYGMCIDTNGVTNTSSAECTAIQLDIGTGTRAIVIDADTEDVTSASLIDIDAGINSASCSVINVDAEVKTALNGTEAVKAVDINMVAKAADGDGTSITGVEVTQKAISTARSDLYGVSVGYAASSSMDTADTITGILVSGTNLTINDESLSYHGVEIALAGLVDTDYTTGEFNALDITMPATYQGTDVASAVKITGAGAQVDILSGAGTIYGVDLTCAAATVPINIDADTTDTTAASLIEIDVGVNSASNNVININQAVGTALSAAEIIKAVAVDQTSGVDADTAGMYGAEFIQTVTSTGEADVFGVRVVQDGTLDTGNTITGILVDGSSLTVNNATAVCHGVEIALASLTDTDYTSGEFNALDITMPATYQGTDVASAIKATGAGAQVDILSGSSTIYGVDITCAAGTQAINIDADTADRTAGNVVSLDVGVNSASVNALNVNLDVGTALSSAEIIKGAYFDINCTGGQADANTSGIMGVDMVLTGVTGSAADCTGVKVLLDGTHDQGDISKGILVDLDTTLNNAAEYLYGLHIDGSGVTDTQSVAFNGIYLQGNFTDGSLTIGANTAGPAIVYGGYAQMETIEASFDVAAATINDTDATGVKAFSYDLPFDAIITKVWVETTQEDGSNDNTLSIYINDTDNVATPTSTVLQDKSIQATGLQAKYDGPAEGATALFRTSSTNRYLVFAVQDVGDDGDATQAWQGHVIVQYVRV